MKDNKLKNYPYVLNLFGGPGIGKSSCMHLIAGLLMQQGLRVEIAEEWVKNKIYEGLVNSIDQIYAFAKQRKKIIDRVSDFELQVVITDSPMIMPIFYMVEENAIFEALALSEFKNLII